VIDDNQKPGYTGTVDTLPRHDLRHEDGRVLHVYGAYDGSPLVPAAPGDPGGPAPVHLRRNRLTGGWVAISPARNVRPQARAGDTDDPACPLCPGGPEVPFGYDAAVFDNRFPTLLPHPPAPPDDLGAEVAPARGRCEVVLYTPTHTGSLATLTPTELARVVAVWTDRSRELRADPSHRYVLVFENRGEEVGATLPHPHGQIYALAHLPAPLARRVERLHEHRRRNGRCLTCEVVADDLAAAERALGHNASFTVGVPFAPDWPFEVHVRARRHGVRSLTDLTAEERRDLAAGLRDVVRRYDRIDDAPAAYMMVCHQSPVDDDGEEVADWHLGFEFLPPRRAAGKHKVRASVETATGLFINDTVPESSAAELRGLTADDDPPPDPSAFPDLEIARG
jgi:UDPglucose--hexose-1-phosphate uridylyltransferase